MTTSRLLLRNLSYHWRTHSAVVCGVAIAVAVLSGALLVGDSVRGSLRELFLARIGNTDLVLSSGNFFRAQLAEDLKADSQFADTFDDASALIVLHGVVTHQISGRRAGNVLVYGVDTRFWEFHGLSGRVTTPSNRETFLSPSLAHELDAAAEDTLLLRIEKPAEIPTESLHGDRENLGRTVRLSVRGTLAPDTLGEFSTIPRQTAIRAVFVPLDLMQRELDQQDRVNTILIAAKPPQESDGTPISNERLQILSQILKRVYVLEDVGLRLRVLRSAGSLSLESFSMILDESTAATARDTAEALGMSTSGVLTYLANSIRSKGLDIPYSLVTAMDGDALEALRRDEVSTESSSTGVGTEGLAPILVNEWAARALRSRIGDRLALEYYVWKPAGELETRVAEFRVAGVVAMQGAALDRDLAPHYPGITEATSLSDWDPPFPMNLGRIGSADESYWDQFGATPKAFLTLEAGQRLWASRYGKLTSVRFRPPQAGRLTAARESFEAHLKDTLDPFQKGFSVYPIRAQGLLASRGATDFGEYFLYFSFFLVVSALLLAGLFFKLGVEQRRREIGILKAIGFGAPRILRLFVAEGFFLSLLGSLVGVASARVYGGIIMHGLGTWWVDAVGTTSLTLHTSPLSLVGGATGGVLTSLLITVLALRGLRAVSPRDLLTGAGDATRFLDVNPSRTGLAVARLGGLLSGLAGATLLVGALSGLIGQVAGFFGAGMLLMTSLICYQAVWLRKSSRRLLAGHGTRALFHVGFRNTTYRTGRSVLSIALIAFATFIIVAVEAFRRDGARMPEGKRSGSGGYSLMGEALLPLIHDPNTAYGREELNLVAEDASLFEGVAISRWRLRPGEDTSCLNLYQPKNPKIVGVPGDVLREGRFVFRSSLAESDEERLNPWLLLEREMSDGVVPVVADANSLTYVLHLQLGDELVVQSGSSLPLRMRIVGSLADSIFQGVLLMSETHFIRSFPEQEGYRFFLIDVPREKEDGVAAFLEERLGDFGLDVISTREQLAQFHRVENTYLSTFQSLGGLGLLLGTIGLGIVLMRNVMERRRELALQRAVGYRKFHLALTVVAENLALLSGGILTGTVSALLAIAPAYLSRGGHLSASSLFVIVSAVALTGLLASLVATSVALRSPLLAALRSE